MRLERVELFVLRMPLKRAYETSGSRETHQTRVICRGQAEGIAGWGESVAPEQPWYSGETPKTVWYALEEYIVPQLFRADLKTPEDTSRALGWIREPRMAKATIETAIWDLFAKREAKPLSAMLGGTRARILCGVAIGIQPSLEALFETIARELEGGYQRVKLKIKPGWDAKVAEAVRNAYPDLAFMLDANSAYSLDDVPVFKRIDAYTPTMIEQPLAHDVHLAALPNFRLPGDVSASARYFETEIIGEPFVVERDGTMKVPTGAGIGVTVLEDVIRKLALERKKLRPD